MPTSTLTVAQAMDVLREMAGVREAPSWAIPDAAERRELARQWLAAARARLAVLDEAARVMGLE